MVHHEERRLVAALFVNDRHCHDWLCRHGHVVTPNHLVTIPSPHTRVAVLPLIALPRPYVTQAWFDYTLRARTNAVVVAVGACARMRVAWPPTSRQAEAGTAISTRQLRGEQEYIAGAPHAGGFPIVGAVCVAHSTSCCKAGTITAVGCVRGGGRELGCRGQEGNVCRAVAGIRVPQLYQRRTYTLHIRKAVYQRHW